MNTKEGGQKAKATNLAKNPNFYHELGKSSWKDPNRNHSGGFANMSKEKRKAAASKGGRKSKRIKNEVK